VLEYLLTVRERTGYDGRTILSRNADQGRLSVTRRGRHVNPAPEELRSAGRSLIPFSMQLYPAEPREPNHSRRSSARR